MAIAVPYFSVDQLRRRAKQFLEEHHPDHTIPIPIEHIVESQFDMDIVPVPGLQAHFDVVAYITKDMREIRVDEYVYQNRQNRYRFSLAHELAHKLLHVELWQQFQFNSIESWKTVITDSISEKQYGYVEFHANTLAGLILVPGAELNQKFAECMGSVRQAGLDVSDEATGARDIVEDYIARYFVVSRDVIHRRIEADKLWRPPEST